MTDQNLDWLSINIVITVRQNLLVHQLSHILCFISNLKTNKSHIYRLSLLTVWWRLTDYCTKFVFFSMSLYFSFDIPCGCKKYCKTTFSMMSLSLFHTALSYCVELLLLPQSICFIFLP